MKVSIVTVSLNSHATIEDTIISVVNQTYPAIEHIIIDGGSKDGTVNIIHKYSNKIKKLVSEPDKGIYDAMNKGINLATGEIVGFLNADDVYFDKECVAHVVNEFRAKNVDSVFADLVYVYPDNLMKVVRYYSSKKFSPRQFAYGWMPAHPTFFAKRNCYGLYGLFKTDYMIASDYELLIRFLSKYKITYSYIPKVLVKMRMGGISTRNLKNNWILNREIIRACSENGIKTNMLKVLSKYSTKALQLIEKPK
ncbi:MAG: hypothetical protein SRB2_00429 [Desulfobacteraceae bacterium Eth-SRB2]|nr:MAG: hypothetical protein SRB2_00429 [Desulfobacteraceae bacterium Eth-SRB2]